MLVRILDGTFFVSGLLGVSTLCGYIENGGSVLIPLLLLAISFFCYKWARYENGDMQRRRKK